MKCLGGSRVADNGNGVVTIESKILVGTHDGFVIALRYERGISPSGVSFSLQLETKRNLGVGKKPVESLLLLNGAQRLLCICDGLVYTMNSRTLEILDPTANSKSDFHLATRAASSLVVDSKTKHSTSPRICVATRKKILFYEFARTMRNFVVVSELVIEDKVACMLYVEDRLFFAAGRDYHVIKVGQTVPTLLFNYGEQHPALSYIESEGSIFLLTGEIAASVDKRGYAKSELVQFSRAVSSITDYDNFIIGWHSSGDFVIKRHDVPSLMQVTSLPGVNAAVSVPEDNFVLLTTPSKIVFLVPNQLSHLIRGLIEDLHVSEGVELFTASADMSDSAWKDRAATVYGSACYYAFISCQFKQSAQYLSKSDIDPREIASFVPQGLQQEFEPLYSYDLSEDRDILSMVRYHVANNPAYASLGHRQQQDKIGTLVLEAKQCVSLVIENWKHVCAVEGHDPFGVSVADMDCIQLFMYVDLDSPALVQLVSSPNHCSLERCLPYLHDHQQYHCEALLLLTWGEMEKALAILEKLGCGDLQDESSDAVDATVRILQGVQDASMILRFGDWVLRLHPENGLLIFTARRQESPLDPQDVLLEYLAPHSDDLKVQYLEHLIWVQNSVDEQYHTRLAILYLDAYTNVESSAADAVSLRYRQKLHTFLKSSQHYNFAILLARVRDAGLYEETALLLGKTGLHGDALQVMVFQMGNLPLAVNYCLVTHEESAGPLQNYNPYLLLLLELCLSSDLSEIQQEGWSLLDSHGPLMDPLAVLELLPKDISLHATAPYLIDTYRSMIHKRYQYMIMKSLSKTENLEAKCELIEKRGRNVRVLENTICPVCKKRIGDKVFVSFPNNITVHFKCQKEKHICPITGKDFRDVVT